MQGNDVNTLELSDKIEAFVKKFPLTFLTFLIIQDKNVFLLNRMVADIFCTSQPQSCKSGRVRLVRPGSSLSL